MSNLRNRFLALAIVVVMLVAALGSTAFAATTVEFTDITDIKDEKMVKMLNALGIVLGREDKETGTYTIDEKTPVTRQEMAMFLARIKSATPGAFNDSESYKNVKTPTFEDVTDKTFLYAIEYCYSEGIINGKVANVEFDPTGLVKLDEALAMIVRALGYADLSYPIESTKKAKELGFALTYRDNEGSKELNRIEVIRLLYTYFFSDEQENEVVRNEVTGIQTVQRVPHPVMEKFGINVQEAYIVRSGDYTANITTKLLTPTDKELPVPAATNIPKLTTAEIAAGKDVILAYPTFKVVSSNATGNVDGYYYTGKWIYIATSKAALEGTEGKSDRYLAGLKVIYYQDTLAVQSGRDLGILSYVKGEKIDMLADKDNLPTANINKDRDNDFADYSKALKIGGIEYDLRQNAYQVSELTNADIYRFGTDATLRAGVNTTTNTLNDVKELARFIYYSSNYGLEYVVNDENETFYIFTPYIVGYYDGTVGSGDDKDEPLKLDNVPAGSPKLSTKPLDPSNKINITDMKTNKAMGLTAGNAYLYTIEGMNLNIFDTLYRQFERQFPTYIYSNEVGFLSGKVTFSGNNQYIAKSASTSAANYSQINQYSGFSMTKDSSVFYVKSHGTPDSDKVGIQYGVLASTPILYPNYLNSGKLAYLYSIYVPGSRRVEQFYSDIGLTGAYKLGDIVSYQKMGDFYRVNLSNNQNFITQSTAANEYKGNGYTGLKAGNSFTYTQGTSYLTDNSLTGIVNNNTSIFVSEYNSLWTSDAYSRSRTLTVDEWNKIASTITSSGTYQIEMVTTLSTGLSVAKVIHIMVNSLTVFDSTLDTNAYYVVTDLIDSNYGYGSVYSLVKGYNYLTGDEKNFAVEGSFVKGALVRFSYDRYTTFGSTSYNIADPIPGSAAKDAMINGTRGAFTQPSAVMTYLGTLTNTQLAGFNRNSVANGSNGIGNLFMYPIARLSNGIVHSTIYDRTTGNSDADPGTLTVTTAFTITSREIALFDANGVEVPGTRKTLYGSSAGGALSTITDAGIASGTDIGTGLTNYKLIKNNAGAPLAEETLYTAAVGDVLTGDIRAFVEDKYIGLVTGIYIQDSTNGANVWGHNSGLTTLTGGSAANPGTTVSYCDAISKLTGRKVNFITVTIPSNNGSANIKLDITTDGMPTIVNLAPTTDKTQYFVITNNPGEYDFADKIAIPQNQYSDVITIVKIVDER